MRQSDQTTAVAVQTDAGADGLTEVLFYHLEQQPLERVLPVLAEKTLERGLRAVIQVTSEERLAALDQLLWTYRDESFLPHAPASDTRAPTQPIVLTLQAEENPNGASVRFYCDGAAPEAFEGYARLVYLFNGHDPDAVSHARTRWKAAKAAGCALTYWQQNAQGRWEKKA
ncbi:MAG: DNA polymerase III subunit chi [Pseudomonadota bacterium]